MKPIPIPKFANPPHQCALKTPPQHRRKTITPRKTLLHPSTSQLASLSIINLEPISKNCNPLAQAKRKITGRLGTCLSSQHKNMETPATQPARMAPVSMMISMELADQSVVEVGMVLKLDFLSDGGDLSAVEVVSWMDEPW